MTINVVLDVVLWMLALLHAAALVGPLAASTVPATDQPGWKLNASMDRRPQMPTLTSRFAFWRGRWTYMSRTGGARA